MMPESVTLQVASILWSGNGITVFSGRRKDGARLKVVGKGREFLPVVGEVYEVRGEWRPNQVHGWQLHGDGDAFRRLLPSGSLVGPWLERIPGVGPARAERLMKAFDRNLDHVLEGGVSVEKLAEVIDPDRPNLAIRVAVAVVRQWDEVKGEYETVKWLEEQGVEDVRAARLISRLLGAGAVELMRRNPYVLASVIPWARLDPIAQRITLKNGVATDPAGCRQRIVGAIDVVMQDAASRGDTAVPKAGFEARVMRKLGLDDERDLECPVLHAGLGAKAIVDAGDRWRAPGCAVMEEEVLARLRALAMGQERSRIRIPARPDLRRMLAMVERRGRQLFPEQRDAVLATVERQFSCLTGGGGTGKTTTCRAIVDLWELLGGHVELAALSGKAAMRLGAGAGRARPDARPALTIHRLLLGLLKRKNGETHWGKPPAEADPPAPGRELPELTADTLLVIDEASMVDLGQMHQVIEAMPPGCRLVMVGDEFQLPPVGFGLVFHHLVLQDAMTARLEIVRRQEDRSGIPAVARSIRSLHHPTLQRYRAGLAGVSFLAAEEGAVSDAIERVALDLGGFGGGPEALMVLAAVNGRSDEADGTVRELNRRFQRLNASARAALGRGEVEHSVAGYSGNVFTTGDPVSFQRNAYESGLRNGSLGIVTGVDPDTRSVTCSFDGEEHQFAGGALIDLALAYAITCHRAQGSQARAVVISLVDAPNVDPSWLYTALTRAEEVAVLVGEEAALATIMKRAPAFQRRLTGCDFPLA
ncbi:AAA family ATPase [Methylobacterium brachiatum]